jgi:hypothetical protein
VKGAVAGTGSRRSDEGGAFADERGTAVYGENTYEVCAQVGHKKELGGRIEQRFVWVRG